MLASPPPSHSVFTVAYNGRVNVLKTNVYVSEAFDPNSPEPHPNTQVFIAIWDTGATNSVITKRVIDSLNLKPTGRITSHTVGGSVDVDTYLVNMLLPNRVGVQSLRVSQGELSDDADILIGMDIISGGDFAVTNYEGKTRLSFRIPSIEQIDFVEDAEHYKKRFQIPQSPDEKRQEKNKRKAERRKGIR